MQAPAKDEAANEGGLYVVAERRWNQRRISPETRRPYIPSYVSHVPVRMQVAKARLHQPLFWPRRAVPTVQAWRAEEHEEKSGCRTDERGQSAFASAVIAINAPGINIQLEIFAMASTPVKRWRK